MKSLWVVAFFLLLAGCRPTPVAEKPEVAVSILPLKYFVDRLSGGDVEATVLVPPGASPETWESTPRQMAEIARAEAYFHTGLLDFERSTVAAIRENTGDQAVVDLSEGLPLIETDHGHVIDNEHVHGADPHIWLSPVRVKPMLERIEKALVRIMPDSAAKYARNKRIFISSIDSLDRSNHALFERLTNKTVLIYHPFLTYFAADYGLTQAAVEQEGREPSAGQFRELLERTDNEGLTTVIFQRELHAPTIEAFVRENGLKAVSVDPLAYDWLENMGEIAATVRESMK